MLFVFIVVRNNIARQHLLQLSYSIQDAGMLQKRTTDRPYMRTRDLFCTTLPCCSYHVVEQSLQQIQGARLTGLGQLR